MCDFDYNKQIIFLLGCSVPAYHFTCQLQFLVKTESDLTCRYQFDPKERKQTLQIINCFDPIYRTSVICNLLKDFAIIDSPSIDKGQLLHSDNKDTLNEHENKVVLIELFQLKDLEPFIKVIYRNRFGSM